MRIRDLLWAGSYTGGSTRRNAVVAITGWVSAILFIFTVGFLLKGDNADPVAKLWAARFPILWAVYPPTWFWIDYHMVYLTANPTQRPALEQFKYSQEVSRNIWLALVGVLLAVYFK
jgi:hypothetical protein